MNFTNDVIIWSADASEDDIRAVIESEALPKGTVIKLDRLFFENYDKDFISFCQDAGYPVFCDAKIIEIPDKSLAIAKTYLNYHPFMLNIMAGACSTMVWESDKTKQIDALKRFADACAEAGTRSCGVSVLTSKNESMCQYEFSSSPVDQVLKYVELLYKAGFTDIVCSPKEASAIRQANSYGYMSINTPGIRLPDSNSDDQQRITTPFDALKNGASRLVIGRDLTRGEGKITSRVKHNYQEIVKNIFAIK